ncbi:hypothetical protein CCR75_001134 [Bremia lactucae]|uniref:Deoxyuridine 5'-triphosphate nucleotidohydrolase n=1 Tax=Bremia lactucae TaxID=4779 RepID=A0A976NZX6_BRELC|nr:hypothetical protein CCR75_001134 [Bremia lactucae]
MIPSKRIGVAPILRVKKATPNAILPTRGSSLAAGLDLSAAYETIIPASGKGLVKTDLVIAVPHGCYGRVAPRSGLALRKFIDTGAGVIDADYRGNVSVILFNHSSEDFCIKRGDRIAQLILEKIEYAEVQEVEDIEDTVRGSGAFGSTGVNVPVAVDQHVECNRLGQSDKSVDPDSLFRGIQVLSEKKLLDDTSRRLLIKKLLTASDRQYKLLYTSVSEFLNDGEDAKVMEWIEAFLRSN